MKTKLFILMGMLGGFCYGQVESIDDIAGNNRSWQDMQIGTVFKEVPIQGSPYTDELYKMGIATVNSKEIQLLMRYDAYNDQVEMIDKKQKKFNLLKKDGIFVEFEGKKYKPISYDGELVYVNPLNDGDLILYYKPKKIFVQAEKPEHGYDDYDPPRYEDASFYLVQRNGKMAEKIKLNKGNILKYMRDRNDQVKAYIDEHHLDLRSEADAVKLFNYYNSLHASS